MGEIKKATVGSLAKNKLLNMVIGVVNAIAFNLTVRAGIGDETPKLIVSDNNATLIVSAGGGAGGGGGDGLPEFPGEEPSIEIKAPLIWDDLNGEARWLQGEKQGAGDPKTYLDLFAYDPSPSTDTYSLNRFELLEGIVCENGAPIAGKILFIEDDV